MPRGSHTPKIDYPPVKMVQFAGEPYSEGVEIVERDQVELRVYCVAKTIADCSECAANPAQVIWLRSDL